MRKAAVTLGALLALAGCSSGGDARLRVAIALGAGMPQPTSLKLDVYDRLGLLFTGVPLGDQTGAVTLPGDVVVVLDAAGARVRVMVRGAAEDGTPLQAAGQGPLVAGRETRLELTLSSLQLPDQDGDGVPDPLDNCPEVPNRDQAAAPDGVVGAACAGQVVADLGVVDGTVVPDPPDLAPPPPDLTPTTAVCGNGVVEAGEACDDGAGNSDDPSSSATCTSLCRRRAPCGQLLGSTGARIDPATGHCYVHWGATLRNWSTAQRECEGRGGHLVSITSQAENDLVKQLVGSLAPAWIGLSVVHGGAQPVSKWVTGEPFSFNGYAAGEPNNASGEECVATVPAMNGWDDRPCGFPTSGGLASSPSVTFGYVCESNCGNGVVEPGEECEPPGSATCTTFCQTRRPCTEAGGITLLTNGHCYFHTNTDVTYANAAAQCPAGTHLATLDGIGENEAGRLALGGVTAWIALRAPTTAGRFSWDVAGETFQSRRFHGFTLSEEPNQTSLPACVRFTPDEGWRDTGCNDTHEALCERE